MSRFFNPRIKPNLLSRAAALLLGAVLLLPAPLRAADAPAATPPPAPASTPAADPIRTELDKAKAAADASLADARAALLVAFDERIKAVAATGDLDGVKAVTAEKTAFDLRGTPPASPAMKLALGRYNRAVAEVRGRTKLAYDSAIREYTRALKVDQATAVQSELKAFLAGESAGAASPLDGAILVLTFDRDTVTEKDGRLIVHDQSARKNDAIVQGASLTGGRPGLGLALDFSRESSLRTTANVGITGAQPRTLAFWVNNKTHPTSEQRPLLGWGTNADGKQFHVGMYKSSFSLWAYGWGNDWVPNIPPAKQWQHHAITYDGKTLRWYVDGVLLPNSTVHNYNTADSELKLSPPFLGQIDEIVLIPRALTDDQIAALAKLSRSKSSP